MDKMFYGWSSLSNLPDISKWNIEKVISMKEMFKGCKKDLNYILILIIEIKWI